MQLVGNDVNMLINHSLSNQLSVVYFRIHSQVCCSGILRYAVLTMLKSSFPNPTFLPFRGVPGAILFVPHKCSFLLRLQLYSELDSYWTPGLLFRYYANTEGTFPISLRMVSANQLMDLHFGCIVTHDIGDTCQPLGNLYNK